jgi:hypothetical protein
MATVNPIGKDKSTGEFISYSTVDIIDGTSDVTVVPNVYLTSFPSAGNPTFPVASIFNKSETYIDFFTYISGNSNTASNEFVSLFNKHFNSLAAFGFGTNLTNGLCFTAVLPFRVSSLSAASLTVFADAETSAGLDLRKTSVGAFKLPIAPTAQYGIVPSDFATSSAAQNFPEFTATGSGWEDVTGFTTTLSNMQENSRAIILMMYTDYYLTHTPHNLRFLEGANDLTSTHFDPYTTRGFDIDGQQEYHLFSYITNTFSAGSYTFKAQVDGSTQLQIRGNMAVIELLSGMAYHFDTAVTSPTTSLTEYKTASSLTVSEGSSLAIHYLTCGKTDFPIADNSAGGTTHTVVVNGDVDFSDFAAKFGNYSLDLGNTTTDYLSVADSTDFTFTGDFTIDFWVYSVATGGTLGLVTNGDTTVASSLGIFHAAVSGPSKGIEVHINGVQPAINGSVLSNFQWYHIAVVRSGTTVTLYVDGVVDGTYTYSGTIDGTELRIGGSATNSQFDGYMEEVRVVKDVAKWTAPFTPPSAPYPGTDTDAVLLVQAPSNVAYSNFEILLDDKRISKNHTHGSIAINEEFLNDTFLVTTPLSAGAHTIKLKGQRDALWSQTAASLLIFEVRA